MAKVLFSAYHKEDLKELMISLNNNYYDPIIQSCVQLCQARTADDDPVTHTSINLYKSLCIKLVEEIKQEIENSKYVMIPYVHELYRKEREGHNCSTCSNGCTIQHAMQVQQIKMAHQKIKEIIYRIRQLQEPVNHPEADLLQHPSSMHEEIHALDTIITELFYVEEAILLPKILEAQNRINAAS